ncbi:MAG TPA: stage II sporulation protein D [Symbiobacteriaceae bacterium]|nr:stage II sporulation protein D [Symbiobacteriaceae bacterium]
MRRFLLGGLIALVLVLVALPALLGRLSGVHAIAEQSPPVKTGSSDHLPIRVFFPGTRKIETLTLSDYLKGVVAAEMEPDFETEALKAQMVVARTYALRRMQPFVPAGKGGCPDHAGADICADPRTGQAYISKDDLTAKMGAAAANQLWKRLDKVQIETDGQVVRWKGELIDPLYHSVSGTKTEDSGSYYAQSMPYLKSVDDHWGDDSPRLKKTYRFTAEELAKKLFPGKQPQAVPAMASVMKTGKPPVQVLAYTESGRVKTVKINDVTLTGREFREKLDLQSTNFTVAVEQGQVVVNTVGYGHGVGMSQWGANGMALAGKSYTDILKYYYTGVEVTSVFED